MEYKNLHSYQDFLNEKNELNEGLLGKAFNFLKGKLENYAKKIKASKKIDPIMDEAKSDIQGYFKDKQLIQDFINSKKDPQKDSQKDPQKDPQKEEGEEKKIQEKSDNSLIDKLVKKSDNPLDEAINNKLKLVKKKIEPFIKDDKGKEIYTAKMYAQLKMIELEEEIIKGKIEIYKQENLDSNDLENQIKEKANDSKTVVKNLSKATDNDDEDNNDNGEDKPELEVGQIINYENEEGKEFRAVVTNLEPLEVNRISKIDDKDNIQKEETDDFKPIIKQIEIIGDKYKEKVKKKYNSFIDSLKLNK